MSRTRLIFSLLSGRWQLPAALLAVLVTALAVHRLRPAPRAVDFDAVLSDLAALRDGGKLIDAADACANLLTMSPPLQPAQRAQVHDFLSDTIFRMEQTRPEPLAENARLVLENFEAAQRLGFPTSATRLLRLAQAREWVGSGDKATDAYRHALESSPSPAERRTALHALVRLLEGRPSGEAEREQRIAELLSDSGVSPSYLWSTLQSAIEAALDRDDPNAAADLVERYGGQFARTDLEGYQHYLRARVLVAQERYLEAEPYVRAVDGWLAGRGGVDPEMASVGLLPALNQVLRGQIGVVERRPQEALAAFEKALALDGFGRAFIASSVGRAEALALLERHEAAREVLSEATELIDRRSGSSAYGRGRFGRALLNLAEQRRTAGDPLNAVAYLHQAVSIAPPDADALGSLLLERLGDVAVLAAADPAGAAGLGLGNLNQLAGSSFERAASAASDDPARHAELVWKAALQFEECGDDTALRRMLMLFIAARGSDPRLPGALLRMAQAFEASGDDDAALDWYNQLVVLFPRIEEAPRARLMRARLLLRMANASPALAESELERLLESDSIGPQASVYRDALRTLGAHLYAQQRFAACIRRLEDFLVLYPNDDDTQRTRFMLANAYRLSAIQLHRSPPEGAEPGAVAQTRLERLRLAARHYDDYAAAARRDDDAPVSERDESYLRMALLNHGDCQLELNTEESLTEALAIFRQVAARSQRHPAALVAQVQIANVHLRQGRVTEAARAVETARWLLRAMPDGVFGQDLLCSSRADWDRYLATISAARLFQEFAAAR